MAAQIPSRELLTTKTTEENFALKQTRSEDVNVLHETAKKNAKQLIPDKLKTWRNISNVLCILTRIFYASSWMIQAVTTIAHTSNKNCSKWNYCGALGLFVGDSRTFLTFGLTD